MSAVNPKSELLKQLTIERGVPTQRTTRSLNIPIVCASLAISVVVVVIWFTGFRNSTPDSTSTDLAKLTSENADQHSVTTIAAHTVAPQDQSILDSTGVYRFQSPVVHPRYYGMTPHEQDYVARLPSVPWDNPY